MTIWSMRSWQSVPSPTFLSGRADSQDRMDQKTQSDARRLRNDEGRCLLALEGGVAFEGRKCDRRGTVPPATRSRR